MEIGLITELIMNLTKTFAFSIGSENEDGEYPVVFSKPTNSNPMPNPIVTAYFKINEDDEITFRIENRRYEYRGSEEVDFDKALNFVIDSKIVARSII